MLIRVVRIPRRILLWAAIVALLGAGVLSERWIAGTTAVVPKPIDQIKTDQKAIALTINVDWGEEFLPGILSALQAGDAKATFFVTGRWAKNHPDLVKTIAEQGHEVENHGYSHPHPDRLSVSDNETEIRKTEAVIEAIIGKKTIYYAPPYGEKGPSGLKAAERLGYKTILWTLDTVDWRPESTPQLIAQRVLNPQTRFGVTPQKQGAIVLMHPKENTLKALPGILEQLKKEGFQILTFDELITLEQSGDTTS